MGWRSFYYNPPIIICQIFLVTLRGLYRYGTFPTRPVTTLHPKPEDFSSAQSFAHANRRGRRVCRPVARSVLGSTSGGAVSPNGLTEGVSSVEWYWGGHRSIHSTALLRKRAGRYTRRPVGGSAAPTGAVETMRLQQPTDYTPSASHSLSSSLREGAKGTSCQRAG